MTEPTFSIIVPSMGRTELVRCLFESLGHASRREYELCFGFDPTGLVPPLDLGTDTDIDDHWEADTVKYAVAEKPGMSAAVNAAFSLATGEWIIWLCDDMVALPGWDDFKFDLRQDRALCFRLIEDFDGSFPPRLIGGGDSPEAFDLLAAKRRAHFHLSLANIDGVYLTPGDFFGTGFIHRSRWVGWPEWPDPYSCNDIVFFYETYLRHPDLTFGRMMGNCLYHFVRGSVRHRPDLTPDGEATWQAFLSHYGLTISEAYARINARSKRLWDL